MCPMEPKPGNETTTLYTRSDGWPYPIVPLFMARAAKIPRRAARLRWFFLVSFFRYLPSLSRWASLILRIKILGYKRRSGKNDATKDGGEKDRIEKGRGRKKTGAKKEGREKGGAKRMEAKRDRVGKSGWRKESFPKDRQAGLVACEPAGRQRRRKPLRRTSMKANSPRRGGFQRSSHPEGHGAADQ